MWKDRTHQKKLSFIASLSNHFFPRCSITGKVNCYEVQMLVDTRCFYTLISLELAETLEIEGNSVIFKCVNETNLIVLKKAKVQLLIENRISLKKF